MRIEKEYAAYGVELNGQTTGAIRRSEKMLSTKKGLSRPACWRSARRFWSRAGFVLVGFKPVEPQPKAGTLPGWRHFIEQGRAKPVMASDLAI